MQEQLYKAIKKVGRAMLEESIGSSETPERLLGILFEKVIDELFPPKKGALHPTAEETATELIRLGVPKGSLGVSFMKTTVPLLNVVAVLHRIKYPKGTVQIIWKDYRRTVRPGLPAKDLARALLELDALMTELADFLANPERILAALQPPRDGEVVDTHITFASPFPRTLSSTFRFP